MGEPSPGDQSSGKPRPRVSWWHLLSGAVLVALFTYLTPRYKSPEYAHLT
mgnify:CR=1 FL=1